MKHTGNFFLHAEAANPGQTGSCLKSAPLTDDFPYTAITFPQITWEMFLKSWAPLAVLLTFKRS